MPDREKVIKGWETVLSRDPLDAPWDLIDDTLALLKEQKTANLYKCPNCGTWVSAENVVRCRDCKHSDYGTDEEGNRFMKCIGSVKAYGGTTPDWFCADGERKEGR